MSPSIGYSLLTTPSPNPNLFSALACPTLCPTRLTYVDWPLGYFFFWLPVGFGQWSPARVSSGPQVVMVTMVTNPCVLCSPLLVFLTQTTPLQRAPSPHSLQWKIFASAISFQVHTMTFMDLDISTFVNSFLHKKLLKIFIFWLHWYKDEYNPGWIIATFFLLVLKEIKTFSWASKSIMGPRHWACCV